ncbi:MAG: hypothetical protein H6R26_2070, partial [Proteobacteria bacterium]|nr:hypothetical protein [Pseudomonadota bacterium]
MSTDTLARLQAEARAQAAVAEAKARADSMATNAGASAEELVVKVNRYMHDMAFRPRSMTAIPMRSNAEMIEPEHTDEARPPQIDPDHFLKSVSVHAYYKAEQR